METTLEPWLFFSIHCFLFIFERMLRSDIAWVARELLLGDRIFYSDILECVEDFFIADSVTFMILIFGFGIIVLLNY